MKKEDLVLLAAVAVGIYAVVRMVSKKPAAATGNTYNTTEITRNNGWSYYTDGTAIDPNGVYYYKGAQVYDPRGMYQ
jgi:hypothetical protein